MIPIVFFGLVLMTDLASPVATAVAGAASPIIAEKKYEVRDASRNFDVLISVVYREDGEKSAAFSFCEKGGSTPDQVIRLPDTMLGTAEHDDVQGLVAVPYDQQSAVRVGDFNFDGQDDVALCDGTHANYDAQSYRIFLASRGSRRFVYDKRFSELGQASGMFEVDPAKKVLRTRWMDGHALEVTEEYAVITNRPVKVFRKEIEAVVADDTRVKVTTRRLVKGKWRAKVAFEQRSP